MSGPNNNVAWKILASGGAVLATAATKKLVGGAWRASTGSEPPSNPEDPDTTWARALVWAMLTGAVAGALKLALTRHAASTWRSATGELPPGIAADPAG